MTSRNFKPQRLREAEKRDPENDVDVLGQAGIQLDSSPILSRLGHSCSRLLKASLPGVSFAAYNAIKDKIISLVPLAKSQYFKKTKFYS